VITLFNIAPLLRKVFDHQETYLMVAIRPSVTLGSGNTYLSTGISLPFNYS
jgi:hypothetical protein